MKMTKKQVQDLIENIDVHGWSLGKAKAFAASHGIEIKTNSRDTFVTTLKLFTGVQ